MVCFLQAVIKFTVLGVCVLLFNSYEFIFIYLPLVACVFFGLSRYCGQRSATFWLVLASFFFYGWWDYRYVPLLFASICFNYWIGRQIRGGVGRKGWLTVGIVGNLVLLGYFKYTGFFLSTVNSVAGYEVFDIPHIILPLGISFFTFTQTAYLVEEYRGEAALHSFLTYCEFVTIFPHLIAGPIICHRDMLPQFNDAKNFVINHKNIAIGFTLFAMGLFKKTVIADYLSPWAGEVFSQADSLTFLEAWIGALSYTFQLYFDFSGYSEMAIGLGLMFNLRFPTNFNSPYQACSMIDFWRRWHMTLGLWVRDYLYIPMGGNRAGEFGKMRNLFLSMLLIGLWHGAGWTFVLWGGIHGILLMINHQWRRYNIHLPKAVNWTLTFLCVTVCWVFFRADSLQDALTVVRAMADVGNIVLPSGGFYEKYFGFLHAWGVMFAPWGMNVPLQRAVGTLLALLLGLLLLKNPVALVETSFRPDWRWRVATVAGLVLGILHIAQNSPFLYFQF